MKITGIAAVAENADRTTVPLITTTYKMQDVGV